MSPIRTSAKYYAREVSQAQNGKLLARLLYCGQEYEVIIDHKLNKNQQGEKGAKKTILGCINRTVVCK